MHSTAHTSGPCECDAVRPASERPPLQHLVFSFCFQFVQTQTERRGVRGERERMTGMARLAPPLMRQGETIDLRALVDRPIVELYVDGCVAPLIVPRYCFPSISQSSLLCWLQVRQRREGGLRFC